MADLEQTLKVLFKTDKIGDAEKQLNEVIELLEAFKKKKKGECFKLLRGAVVFDRELTNIKVPEIGLEQTIAMTENEQLGVFINFVQSMISTAMPALEYAKEIEDEHSDLKAFFKFYRAAVKNYHAKEGVRSEKKAKELLNELGITKGKRPSKINKFVLLQEYCSLRAGVPLDRDPFSLEKWDAVEPLDEWDALQRLAERHNLASAESVLSTLRKYANNEKEKLAAMGMPVSGYENILPGNKP